jgi:hypothetical protein
MAKSPNLPGPSNHPGPGPSANKVEEPQKRKGKIAEAHQEPNSEASGSSTKSGTVLGEGARGNRFVNLDSQSFETPKTFSGKSVIRF